MCVYIVWPWSVNKHLHMLCVHAAVGTHLWVWLHLLIYCVRKCMCVCVHMSICLSVCLSVCLCLCQAPWVLYLQVVQV